MAKVVPKCIFQQCTLTKMEIVKKQTGDMQMEWASAAYLKGESEGGWICAVHEKGWSEEKIQF